MERVETLSAKLKDQLAQKASIDQLLTTVEMLQSELMHLKLMQPNKQTDPSAAVHIAPVQYQAAATNEQEHCRDR